MSKKKRLPKTFVCYPLNMDKVTYELIGKVAEAYVPQVTKASVLREALRLGLDILKEKQDDQAKS